jgi:hypothetical protein
LKIRIANPKEFLARVSASQRPIITALRTLIHEMVPESAETVLWDSLSYHRPNLGGRIKGAVCLITPTPDAVHLGFIHGAALADPENLLRGSLKSKRFVPIQKLSDIDKKSLGALIRAAGNYLPGGTH